MTPPRPSEFVTPARTSGDAAQGDAAQGDAAQGDAAQGDAARERARRQRHVDEVFGDVYLTGDERSAGRHDGFPRSHYEASRPPHWGVKQ